MQAGLLQTPADTGEILIRISQSCTRKPHMANDQGKSHPRNWWVVASSVGVRVLDLFLRVSPG
jgi:hypothetical protein